MQSSSTCSGGYQNIGVSRGSKTTKIHAIVDEHFQLLAVAHNSEVAIKLLSKVALKGKKILTDKAFYSEEIREYIFQEKAVASITTSPMLSTFTTLTKNFIKQEKSSKDFFSVSKL